jgi:adhesin/invasin
MQREISVAVRMVGVAGRRGLVLAALAAIGGCTDNTNSVAPLTATAVTTNAATNGQIGVVGAALAQAVGVAVIDQNGAPLANATVTWAIESGGGSVASSTSTTDSNGNATVVWTLGSVAGTDSLKASIASGASTFVTATATAGPAAQIQITSGNPQSVTAGTTTAPLVVQVVDQFANPVVNGTVTWAVTGGGTLSATSTTTDATGSTQVTLATGAAPATYSVTATVGTLAPAVFTINGM